MRAYRGAMMAKFEVEQYELHVSTHEVDAKDEAEAVVKVLQGEGECIDGLFAFVEMARSYGMPQEENPKLSRALAKTGLLAGMRDVIPSIRRVRQVGLTGESEDFEQLVLKQYPTALVIGRRAGGGDKYVVLSRPVRSKERLPMIGCWCRSPEVAWKSAWLRVKEGRSGPGGPGVRA